MLGQVGRSLKIAQNAGQELDLKTRLENEMVVSRGFTAPRKTAKESGRRGKTDSGSGIHSLAGCTCQR
jgi:hypothetical protein